MSLTAAPVHPAPAVPDPPRTPDTSQAHLHVGAPVRRNGPAFTASIAKGGGGPSGRGNGIRPSPGHTALDSRHCDLNHGDHEQQAHCGLSHGYHVLFHVRRFAASPPAGDGVDAGDAGRTGAGVAIARGEAAGAARLLGTAAALRDRTNTPVAAHRRVSLERTLASSRAAL